MKRVEGLLQGLPAGAWSYAWLPRAAVAALLHLVAAAFLQPVAKLQAAAEHLTQGRRCLEAEMQQLGVTPQVL